MPDLLAGSPITALDTPPPATDTEPGLFTFDSGTFGVDADSGTYVECGVTFVVPTTGRVEILFDADLDHSSGTASTEVAPAVRAGSTIGAGATIQAAVSANAIRNVGQENRRYGGSLTVSGMTPGDVNNARLEHRTSGASGTVQSRTITVKPLT